MKQIKYEDMTQAEIDGYELAVDYGLTDGLEEMFSEKHNTNADRGCKASVPGDCLNERRVE